MARVSCRVCHVEYYEPFNVTNAVKQGCVLASTLFSVLSAAMLTGAFKEIDVGIEIRYHINRDFRRLHTRTKVQVETIYDLLFADDCDLKANSERKMQHTVNLFANSLQYILSYHLHQ